VSLPQLACTSSRYCCQVASTKFQSIKGFPPGRGASLVLAVGRWQVRKSRYAMCSRGEFDAQSNMPPGQRLGLNFELRRLHPPTYPAGPVAGSDPYGKLQRQPWREPPTTKWMLHQRGSRSLPLPGAPEPLAGSLAQWAPQRGKALLRHRLHFVDQSPSTTAYGYT